MSNSNVLSSFAALSFDCYGTLVDWEGGILKALNPLTSRLSDSHSLKSDNVALLKRYSFYEHKIQTMSPTLRYSSILEKVYEELATEFGLEATINEDEKVAFGASIGTWAAFPDTVAALLELKKHFKLIILSNVDKDSFNKTLSGPLGGVTFDAVYVAEEIGSYKPDLHNFKYLIDHCQSELGVEQAKLLHTAYALVHDLVPAEKAGLATCWIERRPNAMGGDLGELEGQLHLTSSFKTLGEMAESARFTFQL